ncbi:MAG TPA: hypothetical protein VMM57_04670 [Bacteroidota bacterium]|nr:hypothetical protein [Bacteroidota bacterium]
MAYVSGQGKTAVALFADGLELKFVQLSLKGGKITLREFKKAALVKKFEEKQVSSPEEGITPEVAASDAFASPPETLEGEAAETATNSSVLLGLISDLPSSKYSFSYALSEPAVTFQEFETNFDLKGSKLKKQISEELAANRTSPPLLDAINSIPTSAGGLLSIVREDGLNLYDLLTELRTFLAGRLPNVSLISSSDIGLIELVRAGYQLQEEEVTVVVYIGHDFCRVIFMKGENFLHFAPIISEGYGSPNIENTIYSRILLEQDNIALTRIDRILLAGESSKVNLLEAIGPQFSSAQVEYLKSPEIDVSLFEGGVGEAISEYAIPLITAWKALDPKHPGFYDTNLIPLSITEGQKRFKLAWHGWLAAAAIIASIVFFYTSILTRTGEIQKAHRELAQKRAQLAQLDELKSRKNQLTSDINRYKNAITTYDSIAPGGDRWSRILHYLGNSVEDLNSLWIYQIQADQQDPKNILISGRSIYRTRISRIADIFERAMLREVRTTTVRKKIVYEFDIVVERVDKNDMIEPAFGAAHR